MSTKRAFGVIPGPRDVRNYVATCAADESAFPEYYALEGMPDAENQYDKSACAAFAMIAIMEFHARKHGDYNGKLSPWFLYAYRSNNYTGRGRHDENILYDARRIGTVPYELFPEELEVPEIIELLEGRLVGLVPDAWPFRITESYEVRDRASMKAALMKGDPIYASMEWYDDIKVGPSGLIETKCKSSGNYHAVVIYGWDHNGWLIQNSWGKGWGIEGRAVWPYDVPLNRAFGISDEYSEAYQKRLVEEYISEIDRLTAEVKTREEDLIVLKGAYSDAVYACDQERDKVHGLETKLADIENEKRIVDERCKELSAQIQKMRVELQQQMETSGESIEALKNAITIKESELAFMEADREEYRAAIRALNAQLDKMKELETQVKELRAECAVYEANCIDAKKELLLAAGEKMILEEQLLEIKKPFSSGIGKVIAKVVNFLMRIFYREGKDGADT